MKRMDINEIVEEYKKENNRMQYEIKKASEFFRVGFISEDEAIDRINKACDEHKKNMEEISDRRIIERLNNACIGELEKLCKKEKVSIEFGNLYKDDGTYEVGVVAIKHER